MRTDKQNPSIRSSSPITSAKKTKPDRPQDPAVRASLPHTNNVNQRPRTQTSGIKPTAGQQHFAAPSSRRRLIGPAPRAVKRNVKESFKITPVVKARFQSLIPSLDIKHPSHGVERSAGEAWRAARCGQATLATSGGPLHPTGGRGEIGV